MKIEEGTVVSLDYTLKDDEGAVLDQSQPEQPLVYLQGHRNIIPGLESALEGKAVGDTVEVRVSPEEGYGLPNPALEQVVPKERFQGVEDLQVGMQFQANTDQGPVSVRVISVDGDNVTVDGNHPLAGKHLNFNVSVLELRAATEEELAHGHIQQDSGCCGGGSCSTEAGQEEGCCSEEKQPQEGCCAEEAGAEKSGGCGCA